MPKGSSVNLVISKGPPLTPVPDVYKMSEADAKARLKAAGFKVDVTYPIGITPFGRVVAQSVDAGKSIPWGSTIQIQVVFRGPPLARRARRADQGHVSRPRDPDS